MHVRRVLTFVAVAAALAAFTALAADHWAGAASKSTLAFGHEVVVDHQRVDGEPSLSVSPTLNKQHTHDIYVSAPYGFSTTASFIWKSVDGGKTFHLIGDENPAAFGKPSMTCAGGGDSSIVNDSAGNFYFADLQGLTDISDSVSTDGGDTFTTTCNTANAAGVDRPWLAVYKNPLTNGREYMTVDDIESCDPDNCGLGQTGSNVVELTQASGTGAQSQVFSPLPAQQIEPDGIVGGIVTNQKTGAVYIVHTGFTDGKGKILGGGDANGNTNAIVVDSFPKGYSQSTPTPIPPGSISVCKPYNASGPCTSSDVIHSPLNKNGDSTVNNGQDFSVIAIDTSGNLYVTWAQSPVNASGAVNGPTTVYLATSTNGGKTWTKPINVSGSIPGLQTNVFPWLAAGSRGRVDVAWYGTKTLGNCKKTCGAGFINASWNVYMAQTLNAVSSNGRANSSPSFTATKVTEYPNHYGQICEFGIACTTGGDRGLVDFINVQALPNGAAGIVWADGANTNFNGGETSPVIAYTQQTKGPSLYAGKTIRAAKPRFGSAAGSKASFYAANGSETKAGGNLRILKSSVKEKGKNYIVTMKVKNLKSLSVDPSLGGTDALWLTRWETRKGKPSTMNQGHIFFAAMESDGGGAPSFYVGESVCGVETSHCKGLTYPPGKTIKGKYTTKGTIRLVVPLKAVGGDRKLFSITALTATQTAPGSSGTSIFNVIDSTAPYDLR
jgi:hypothetical protein